MVNVLYIRVTRKNHRMTLYLIIKSQGVVTYYDNECYINENKHLRNWQRIRRAPYERHGSKVGARALMFQILVRPIQLIWAKA